MSMRHLTAAFVLFLIANIAISQPFGGNRGGGPQMSGRFYGKIVDSITDKPIDAASVQLIQNKFDSVSKKRKDVVINGMLTAPNGDFSLENVPVMGQYKLVITAIGFKGYQKMISLIDMKAIKSMRANGGNKEMRRFFGNRDKDLGKI